MKFWKYKHFENFDNSGKCKILIDPWETLKWGKMLEIPVKCIVSSVNPYFTPFF